MSGYKLYKNFIRDPRTTGIVVPSSRHLAHEMTSGVGIENASSIIEIGPGTGSFTSLIRERMRPGTRYFAVEINRELCDSFALRFPDMKIFNRDAAHLREIMDGEGMSHADLIVSGLPWASLPLSVQDNVLNAISSTMSPHGCFTTYAYIQGFMLPAAHRFRNRLKDHFRHISTSRVVWRNLPPAFAYRCRRG